MLSGRHKMLLLVAGMWLPVGFHYLDFRRKPLHTSDFQPLEGNNTLISAANGGGHKTLVCPRPEITAGGHEQL